MGDRIDPIGQPTDDQRPEGSDFPDESRQPVLSVVAGGTCPDNAKDALFVDGGIPLEIQHRRGIMAVLQSRRIFRCSEGDGDDPEFLHELQFFCSPVEVLCFSDGRGPDRANARKTFQIPASGFHDRRCRSEMSEQRFEMNIPDLRNEGQGDVVQQLFGGHAASYPGTIRPPCGNPPVSGVFFLRIPWF